MKKKRTYGGRPPIGENEKKSNSVRVRLSERDIQSINHLHDSCQYKTLSELIRGILLKKPIRVQVKNIEFSKLQKELNEIRNVCTNLLKSKKSEYVDLKPLVENIQQEVLRIANQIERFQTPILLLSDLKEAQTKEESWQSFYN